MRLSKKKIERALMESGGNVSAAARIAGCSRVSVYKWMERHPELEAVREDAEASVTGKAVANVARDIEGGDVATSKWWLERKGGFSQSTVVKGQVDHVHEDLQKYFTRKNDFPRKEVDGHA